MKKISERAIELLVSRYLLEPNPYDAKNFPQYAKYANFDEYMRGEAKDYPNPRNCSSGDVLQAMDEYQIENDLRNLGKKL